MSSRVTTRTNKLSRKRPPPTESPGAALNESSDDFQSPKVETRPPPSKKTLKENAPPTEPTADEKEAVADCPLCGKGFKTGQKMARASHLKSCAAKNGVSTDKLIKIRQLEEKQAEERKALGLAPIQVKAEEGGAKSKPGNNTTVRNTSRAKAVIAASGNEDPHLEMAIALSASLAQEKKEHDTEERQQLESLGLLEPEPSTSAAVGGKPGEKKAILSEVLLPQATTWKAPASTATGRRACKATAKTPLQVRTDADRERQVSERVAAILTREASVKEEQPWRSKFLSTANIGRSMMQGSFLKETYNQEKRFWNSAGRIMPDEQYFSSIIAPFLEDTAKEQENKTEIIENFTKEEDIPTQLESSIDKAKLSSDMFQLLLGKKFSDTVIHCKDGHSCECHYLILLARCPLALRDVVQESAESGVENFLLSWYHATKVAVELFLQFVYSAELGEVRTRVELKSLKEFAREFQLQGLEVALKKVNVFALMSGEEEDEIVSADDYAEDGPRFGEDALIGATQKLDMLLKQFDSSDDEEEKEDSNEKSAMDTLQEEESGDESVTETAQEEKAVEIIDLSSLIQAEKEESEDVFGNSDDDLFGNSNCNPQDEQNELGDSSCNSQPKEEGNYDDIIHVSPSPRSSQNIFSDELPSLENSQEILSPEKSKPNRSVELNEVSNGDVFDCSEAAQPPGSTEEDVWANYYDEPEEISLDPDVVPPSPTPTTPMAGPPMPITPIAGPSRNSSTPKKSERRLPPSRDAVTPMPNYESMLSPALRGELNRFGLKAIPRRKAVQILNHIYEEMHPVVAEEKDDDASGSVLNSSLTSTCSSIDSQGDGTSMPEESILVNPAEDEEAVSASQMPSEQDLASSIKKFIREKKELHHRVLTYDPIWLEDFLAEFKSETKIKCNINQVMDVLDNECVTFRTRARSQRTQRTQKAPRKKKSPKKAKRSKKDASV